LRLCPACGAIDQHNLVSRLCDCDAANYITVIKVSSKEGRVHKCPACGSCSPTGLVWRFLTGNDATASVLATALYQQIPARKESTVSIGESQEAAEDMWSSTARTPSHAGAATDAGPGRRQLLVFSDSRQDAAFFAPYLTRTYAQILHRRLILRVIEKHRESVIGNRWRAQDLIIPLEREARRMGLFAGKSLQEQKTEAWKWVLYELLAIDTRNSLQGLGCLGFSLARPDGWRAPVPLMTSWGLSEDEVWTLFQILLDGLRTKGVVLFPDVVSPDDKFFYPKNREYYVRGDGANSRKHIFSWNPSRKGVMNARLDFLVRLKREGLGMGMTPEACSQVLSTLWSRSLALHDPDSCWRDLFSGVAFPKEGVVHRMSPDFWELRPGTIDPGVKWHWCDRCNRVTLYNLRGVCPTYRCSGRLQECDPAKVFKDNHYRRLYLAISPIELVAEEHTAQLTSTRAAETQTQFVRGDVNVLSCSTTFELGVDVGQLESVFMRNVPPSAANYVQRAGRAGRRTASTAFALTFARRRSHDLTHFQNPKRMVSGEITAPHFDLTNEKIVRRHMYATALAAFWKTHPETFGEVETFFFREGRTGPDLFAEYVTSKPDRLLASLRHIVPSELHERLQLTEWGWTEDLLARPNGVLAKAADEVTNDVRILEEVYDRLARARRRVDFISRSINTIKRRYLLGQLSSRNVIPKYGFPVDVVELQIVHHANEARGLELDRDLRIALSEYAPGSQIVAGDKLWTSRYLKKLPNREWPRYNYAICSECGCYQRVLAESGKRLKTCERCGAPLRGPRRGTFVIPEFGFISDLNPPARPGEARPRRTYTTRVYYSGESKEREQVSLSMGPANLVAIPASEGRLAVINDARNRRFNVCASCGYTVPCGESFPTLHQTPWRTECHGRPTRLSLGHEFKTDILQLQFGGHAGGGRALWFSLLYALLEGASAELDIDRGDIDGCLYPYSGDPSKPDLVLFDDVPGGAGHVRRIARNEATLLDVLRAALERLESCNCGGEQRNTSCYGCLRNYRNQFCHDQLARGVVIDFLKGLGA